MIIDDFYVKYGNTDLPAVLLHKDGSICKAVIRLVDANINTGRLYCISPDEKYYIEFDTHINFYYSELVIVNNTYIFNVGRFTFTGPYKLTGGGNWVMHFRKMGYNIRDSLRMAAAINGA